jgi:hypothetical protein
MHAADFQWRLANLPSEGRLARDGGPVSDSQESPVALPHLQALRCKQKDI